MSILKIRDAQGNVQEIPCLQGRPGRPGDPGYSPVRGIDYWTDADKAEMTSYIDNTVDNIIPTVTASDVGKILRVSADGKWIADTICNAEEVGF